MERYRNLGGNSGVSGFEIGPGYIKVKFTGTAQTYTYSSNGRAGSHHVEQMKTLAQRGSGLNSYINRYAKNLYD